MMLSRRHLLQTGALAPLAAALPKKGLAAGDEAWHAGADPRYRLRLTEEQVAPFGTPIQARLSNGTLPGQALRFTKGERFRVLVENAMTQPTTLHWHGLILPNLQDGVPDLTQAPIQPKAALYYDFTLQQSGTYWYHSHVDLQAQQGLAGPLIIEDPQEPLAYDEDVTLFLSDVVEEPVSQVMQGLKAGGLDVSTEGVFAQPDGKPFPTDVPYAGLLINGQPPASPWTRAVKPGSRVRLRVINGSGSSYFRVALSGASLQVVAADGSPVVPVEVENLVLATAQRYDLLVTIPSGSGYTLQVATLGLDRFNLGYLHSSDSPLRLDSSRPRFSGRALDTKALRAPWDTRLPDGPLKRFKVVLSGSMQRYLWQMNGTTWPEAYADFPGITPQRFFYEVSMGDQVRFDLVNETPMAHPMHLHGHVFRVLEEGQDPADAPLRDTVSVGPHDKVSIAFLANNPGKWIFHCHNAWHLAAGMAQAVRYVI